MIDTPLEITGGLPYNRLIRVKNAALTWPEEEDFEVRSQIRVSPSPKATLKGALTPFITKSIEGDDIVLEMNLTGAQTSVLPGGYYDIVISDVGSTDSRGIRVLKGKITVDHTVTGGGDG